MNAGPEVQVDNRTWQRAGFRIQNGYAWYFGAIGAYVPFAALYFRELGFSGTRIGMLVALLSIGTAIVGPVAAGIADIRGLHRSIIRVGLFGSVIAAIALTQTTSFWPFFLLTALFAACMAPISSLLDGYAMTITERSGISFGRLRVWGSAGYMLVVLVVGRWTGDIVDERIYLAVALGIGLALIATFNLPPMGHHVRPTALSGIREITRNKPLMLLMVIALFSASGTAILNNFLGIHLEEIDGSARLVGPAFAISGASELPVIALGGVLMRRIQPIWLLTGALAIYALRLVIYGTTEQPDLVLVLQAFHGLSFGIFLITTVSMAFRLAGPLYAATAQALLTAMSFGFGSIAGSLIGGLLLDRVGTSGLFHGAAVLMIVTLGMLLIGNRFIPLTSSSAAHAPGTTPT
jgi:PPP family 3-phenylpropionic acid transporter